MCTPHSINYRTWPRRAQIERIVKPLEKRDMAVDIIVASPGCSNAPVSDKMKKRWWAIYNALRRPVLKEAILLNGVGHRAPFDRGPDAARVSQEISTRRGILIWRIDVAPLAPLSAQIHAGDAPTDYLDADSDEIAGVGHGYAWSFPAAILSCFRAVLREPGRGFRTGDWAHSCAAHAAAASGLALRRGPWCYEAEGNEAVVRQWRPSSRRRARRSSRAGSGTAATT